MNFLDRRFSRASDTYSGNIIVQRQMAADLMNMLPVNSYPKILEIGCGCGDLTELVVEKLRFDSMDCNDLSYGMLEACRLRLGLDRRLSFVLGDARKLKFKERSFDLIISNACFQWFSSLEDAVAAFKIWLKPGGILLFSTFGKDNFKEIKELCGVGLDYLDMKQLNSILSKIGGFDFKLERRLETTYFDSVAALFSHLKKTGVTGLSKRHWTRGEIKALFDNYSRRFGSDGKVKLTWDAMYALCRLL